MPATYGWPDTRRVTDYLEPMLNGAEQIEMSKVKADWKFSRCLHKNAAYAVFKALVAEQKGHHVYNVAEDETHTEFEWCKKIAKLCGWQGEIVISENLQDGIDLGQDFYVSTNKIRNELGFIEKFDPEEGLAENVKLYAYQRFNAQYKPCY